MGAGIAQLAATHGCTVYLIDVNEPILRRAIEGIDKQFVRLVEKGRMSDAERKQAVDRIRPLTSISELRPISNAAPPDLAIEAVVEDLTVKHRVFRELAEATPSTTVLATNTSSLSVTRIAESVADAGRVVGMHFFNPAPLMPLVEVIAGARSDPRAVDIAFDVAKSWGKTAVRVKDTPGFIVNRVARGYYLEALRLLGEGVAGVDEIDLVMKKHGGFKMGPFELMDLVGLDVNLAVSTSVWEQMRRHARFAPHDIQRGLVNKGHLGRKTGRGFYDYSDERHPLPAYAVDRRSFQLNPLLSDAMKTFTRRAGAEVATSTEQYVFSRILGAVINEAGHALSDGVASREDIDTAMIKGTNYPKGPLAWADEIGPRTVRGLLKSLNDAVDDGRYEPAPVFAEAL